MAFPCYLAMTAAEFALTQARPDKLAWMACHFSPYGTGLSNRPEQLPKGAMVILNDRTPIHRHDPELVAGQLLETAEKTEAACVLLDFQRPDCPETAAVAQAIVQAMTCPVGVSKLYAGALSCPVFLPPPPLDQPLEAHLAPWQGREIWLEAALDAETITLTQEGPRFAPSNHWEGPETGFQDETLHCHYSVEIQTNQIRFTLFRTWADLKALFQTAAGLGVTQAVGLFQELGRNGLPQAQAPSQ